jgi:uncharacterized membrane protein (DUF4010 family)
MEQGELFSRLGIALAIGLLIGLERGWKLREEKEGERTAGLRTHALAGLLGGVSAATAMVSSYLFLAAAFLAFSTAFTLYSWHEAAADRDFSVTGVVAGILTFTLGSYAVLGDPIVAIASAVAMAALLALKQPLHSWIKRLSWLELRAVLVLLAMTFLLLPILPNAPIDPWNTINPAEIWLMAILVAAMSFAGYVAIRATGDHAGIILAGIAGGLASSTATTLSLARMAREHAEASTLLAAGILFAGVAMVARIAVIIAVFNQALFTATILPLAAAMLILVLSGAFLLYRSRGQAANLSILLRNPFDLLTALKLTALIATVMVLAQVLSRSVGGAGVLALAAVSGLVDVDALTLSMARQASPQIALEMAANAILLCAGVNTAAKSVMTMVIGGRTIGWIVMAASAVTILALLGTRTIALL